MWEPRRLTTLWASTACYRNSFTFSTTYSHLIMETVPINGYRPIYQFCILIIKLNLNWYTGGGVGVQLGPIGNAATNRPIVPAPDDYDDGEIGGMIVRGNRSTRRKPCPSATLSTTNPTCCPEANPGRCGGKPATNRFSYGTALFWACFLCDGSLGSKLGNESGWKWLRILSNDSFSY
jgi:hypothetical protein